MPGNPLHAEVTADSSDYVSAVETARASSERLGDQAIDTGTALQVLQGRADEAGDEMKGAGRSATSASARFGGLTLSTTTLTGALITLGAVSTGTTAALAALSTTIFPLAAVVGTLVAGLGSLVAVFGGLTAVGAVTHMKELKAAFAEAKTQIMELIQPLGEVLGPLLVDAVEALPTLVKRILDAIGPMDQFRDAMLEFGQIAMDVIPMVVGAMVDLARMALPPLQRLIKYVRGSAGGAFQGMLRVTRELAPEMLSLVDAVLGAIAPLTKLGTIILNTLLPVLTQGVRWLTDLVQAINWVILESKTFRSAVTKVATTLRNTVGGALSLVTGLWDDHGGAVTRAARQGYQQAKRLIDRAVRKVKPLVGGALGRAKGLWNQHSTQITRIASDAYGFITSEASKVLKKGGTPIVSGPLGLTLGAFRKNWKKIEKTVGTAINQIDQTLSTISKTLKTQLLKPLSNSESQLRKTLKSMTKEVRESFSLIRNTISKVLNIVLTQYIRPTLKNVNRLWRKHLSGPNGIVANARTAFNNLYKTIIKPTLDIIQGLWRAFDEDVLKIVRGLMGTLESVVSIGLDAILTSVNVILDLLSGDFEGAWNSIVGFTKRTLREIGEWLKTSAGPLINGAIGVVISAIKAPFEGLYNWLFGNSLIKDLIRDPAQWLKNTGVQTIKSAFQDIVGGVKDVFGGIGSWFTDKISGLGNNLVDGIKDAVNGAIDWVNNRLPDTLSIPRISIGGQSINLPSTTIGGHTIGGGSLNVPTASVGGQSIDLPSLDTGGLIEEDGLAMLHAGEEVVSAAEVDRDRSGGGTTIVIKRIEASGREEGQAAGEALRNELDALDV